MLLSNMCILLNAAGDNAYEQMGHLVDDRAGRKLVAALNQCRVVYETKGRPTADKFHGSQHNPQFKAFTLYLRELFQVQALAPYINVLRPTGTSATNAAVSVCSFLLMSACQIIYMLTDCSRFTSLCRHE